MLRLARRHWRYGLGEVHRSLSRKAMVKQIQRMLPDVAAPRTCTRPAPGCGRRPCNADGTLVDDFLFVEQGRVVAGADRARCCTCSTRPRPRPPRRCPIGREILERLTGERLAPLMAA